MRQDDTGGATVEFEIHLARGGRGAVEVRSGAEPKEAATTPTGTIPRVSKLMALALRIEDLVRRGEIRDYADAARLAHVTRARMAQIVGLACLAPDIIEEVLHLPLTVTGRDQVTERHLRPLTSEPDWAVQVRRWRTLRQRLGLGG